MKKQMKIFALLLAFVFLLCSCQKENRSCEELLQICLEYGVDGYQSTGYVFLKSADESDVFYLSEKTKHSMYGEKFDGALERTKDFAIYVSASGRYEIAIFECYSRNDTDEILKMCYERADEIKIGLRFTEWQGIAEAIEIQVYKKHVIFALTDSAQRNEGVIDEVRACLS